MKYTREHLKQMAATFLEARSGGVLDQARAEMLLLRLMARTGLPKSQCLLNLIMLA